MFLMCLLNAWQPYASGPRKLSSCFFQKCDRGGGRAGGQFGSEVVDLLDLTGVAHAFDQIRCYGRGGAVIRNCPQNIIEF